MALSKTFSNDFGTFNGAYHKIFRFEIRTAGQVPVRDADGAPVRDLNGDVVTEEEVTAEVQVHVYPNKEKADADAKPLEVLRVTLSPNLVPDQLVAEALAACEPIVGSAGVIGLMKAVLYRALKAHPQFADSIDV